MESGAAVGTTSRGIAVYVFGGRVYLDYGMASSVNRSGVELSFPAPIGNMLLEIKVKNTGASMFIDGVRVAYHNVSFLTAKAGGDVGGIGGITGNGIRATRGGWGLGQGTYTGSITNAVVFRDPDGLMEPAVEP